MASENPNVETLKWAYGHWIESRGTSAECWLVIADDDICIRSAADEYSVAKFGAVPRGKDGLRWYINGITQTWAMELYEVKRFVADGDDVAVLIDCAWRHRVTNRLVATRLANFWSFRDGKAVSMTELFDTASMIQASQPLPQIRIARHFGDAA